MPTVEEIFEDPPEFHSNYSKADSEVEFEVEEPQDNPDKIEPGDRVFMTTVHNPAEFIRATATTSQCLAEAFTQNSAPPKSFHESVPSQFHDFEEVFSKVSLMHCRTTSHGIMLLSWSSEQRHPPPRCTHYLRTSRLNWTPSLRRIWHLAGSVPPNPQWQLRYSSSRKRMAVSDWSRTIGH
jgi:hypothetical protein